MIRTLAANCDPILVCSKDDRKTVADNASDDMAVGAVRALCEFSLLVSQQNHSDLSFKTLDDAPKQLHQKKGTVREQKISKSAMANADYLLATESHQIYEQKIYEIRASMQAFVYGAEIVSTTKHRKFEMHLKTAWQAATTWADADH